MRWIRESRYVVHGCTLLVFGLVAAWSAAGAMAAESVLKELDAPLLFVKRPTGIKRHEGRKRGISPREVCAAKTDTLQAFARASSDNAT